MTSPRLLLPLRLPELGPYLGKVVTGTGRTPGGLQLDVVRYRLATRIFEAAGEARRLAVREDRGATLSAVGRTVWLEAWEEAVAAAADSLADRVTVRLEAEARAVGLPRRKRRRLLLDAAERRALGSRLGSAGSSLVPALDRLEQCAALALGATALERDAVEAWQGALKTAGRRLEGAWLGLEQAIEREALHWDEVATTIARWRKPLWPVVVVGGLAVIAAVCVGLVLGGYLTPPPWLDGLWTRISHR